MIRMYTRVSTLQQDTASQLPDMRAFAEGKEVAWYEEKRSGKTMDRPKWNQLNMDAKRGDTVVVWRLDRLGRTAAGLTRLFDELRERGINLVSVRDAIDLATPAGRLVANVLASVAQWETEVRAERVQAGQAVARKAGKRWGGSKKGKEISTRATEEQQATLKRLYAEGQPIAAISRATGLSRPTVYRYL